MHIELTEKLVEDLAVTTLQPDIVFLTRCTKPTVIELSLHELRKAKYHDLVDEVTSKGSCCRFPATMDSFHQKIDLEAKELKKPLGIVTATTVSLDGLLVSSRRWKPFTEEG